MKEMVFDLPGYTDASHKVLEWAFLNSVTPYTLVQLQELVCKKLSLTITNKREKRTLSKVIRVGITKLIQKGIISKVVSRFSTEDQWMNASVVKKCGYVSVTDEERHRARSAISMKKICHRALNLRDLHNFNQKTA